LKFKGFNFNEILEIKMKKIIVLLTAVFMFAGLFGQGKGDSYEKITNILDSYGKAYEIFFEGDITFKEAEHEDKITTTVDKLSSDIEALIALDITGIVMYTCAWGAVPYYTYSCMAAVIGSNYNGIMHTLVWTQNGNTYSTSYTTKPVLGKGGDLPFPGEFWKGCGQLWRWIQIYIPPSGGLPGYYVNVRYPFGNTICNNIYW